MKIKLTHPYLIRATHLALLSFSIACFIPLSNTGGEHIPHLDKLVHFTAYYVITFLYLAQFKNHRYRVILLLIAHGVLVEVFQGFTAYRSFELYDIFSDTLGILTAAIFIRLLQRQ